VGVYYKEVEMKKCKSCGKAIKGRAKNATYCLDCSDHRTTSTSVRIPKSIWQGIQDFMDRTEPPVGMRWSSSAIMQEAFRLYLEKYDKPKPKRRRRK